MSTTNETKQTKATQQKQEQKTDMTRDEALNAFAQALKHYLLDQFGAKLKLENRKRLEDFDPMTIVMLIPLLKSQFNITCPEDLDRVEMYAPIKEYVLIYVSEVTFTEQQENLVKRYIKKLVQYS